MHPLSFHIATGFLQAADTGDSDAPGQTATARGGSLLPLFIAFLSGMAALGHEMVWTRALVDIAGASNATFSKVIGVFFLGLSTGGWWAATWRKRRNPWRVLALVEVSIALGSIPILYAFGLTDAVTSLMARTLILQWAVPLGAIFLPSFAMGCSLPALVAASPGTRTVQIYAANTLGGVVGAVGVTFLVFPALGLQRTGLGCCALNALLAGLAWRMRPVERARNEAAPEVDRRMDWRLAVCAFGSGFCLEVLVQHQLAQVAINSLFSSAAVLAIILLALGLGGVIASWLGNRLEGLAVPICLGAAFLGALEPLLFTWQRSGVNILPYELAPVAYGVEILKLAAVALIPMFLAGGLLFPVALTQAGKSGRSLGLLLAFNGFGGWTGAWVVDFWAGPNFGLWVTLAFPVAAYGLLAIVLGDQWRSRGFSAVVTLLLVGLVITSGSRLPQASVLSSEKLHSIKMNPEGVVATVESAPGDWRILFNNSYTLGGSRAQFNQERQALLPLLLHANPKSVGVLGIATGSTTAGATLMPGVETIEAVELSSAVLADARKFFASFNRHAFDDPRVEPRVEDARWIISGRKRAYDVVIGDLFLPWRTGEGRLFSVEHFQRVRESLKPGGLFCQWLPLFQLTESQFKLILATFREVFPETMLVRGDFYTDLPILGLVGNSAVVEVPWKQIRSACEKLAAQNRVQDPLLRHPEGIAMLLLGPAPSLERPGRLNTLANAALELEAGRNIIGLRTPWFIGVPQAKFFQGVHRVGQQGIAQEFKEAHDAGQYVLTMEVASRSGSPYVSELKAQFDQRIPKPLLDDAGAEWAQWPASVKPHRGGATQ